MKRHPNFLPVTIKLIQDVAMTTKSTKYSSVYDHSPLTTPPMAEPGDTGAKYKEKTVEEEVQTVIK